MPVEPSFMQLRARSTGSFRPSILVCTNRTQVGCENAFILDDWSVLTKETKYPHADWEAGRAVIARLLPSFSGVVDHLRLEPALLQIKGVSVWAIPALVCSHNPSCLCLGQLNSLDRSLQS